MKNIKNINNKSIIKRRGRMSLIICILMVMLTALFLTSCISIAERIIDGIDESIYDEEPYYDSYEDESSEDVGGSSDQIATKHEKGGDWKQIVKDSKFKTGNPFVREKTKDYEYRTIPYGSYPVIDGSTVCVPLAMEFTWQHLDIDEKKVEDMVYFSKTDDAYLRLIYKEISYVNNYYEVNGMTETSFQQAITNLILVTEPSERIFNEAKNGNVTLDVTPICYDSFVFITHKDNPVDSLTIEQIQGIYSGKITNWKEVGGKDEEIIAYQRNEGSGSQTEMENNVMNGIAMKEPLKKEIETGMGSLIDAVSLYENKEGSIGYTFKYYIDNQYTSSDIKCISVNGIVPDYENVQTKKYPFTTNYYAVIREEDKDESVGEFVQWIISEEGQACVEQAGYCPLS